MQDNFKNLRNIDPLLNSLIVNKLKELQLRYGLSRISVDDLSERDELDLLREYCLSLYREYRSLRTMYIENMQGRVDLLQLKDRMN
jgi:uncharacterized protein YnzC (UPF0291/DUF896 family)